MKSWIVACLITGGVLLMGAAAALNRDYSTMIAMILCFAVDLFPLWVLFPFKRRLRASKRKGGTAPE
jgi:hypothetical protein